MNLEYLSRDNPILQRLEVSYRDHPAFDTLLNGSAWESFERGINLGAFRSEAQYQTQLILGATVGQYRAAYDYLRSIDSEGLIDKLGEDGSFGCVTLDFDGAVVSRDLLDSVNEILFLKRHLGWTERPPLNILDIGAGYGRFAHRVRQAFDHAIIYSADAVPVSTFLCEFYLKLYRGLDRQMTVHLPVVGKLQMDHLDLACNIHSFSEQKPEAISWWLDRLVNFDAHWLFIVPHDARFICVAADGTHPDFRPILTAHGFECKVDEPIWPDGVNGYYPEARHTLWRRD